MAREATIHFELYRQLSNVLDKNSEYDGVVFGRVVPEYPVGLKRADIVVMDGQDRPLLVIEAKREGTEGLDRNIDPYSKKVIQQAFSYAGATGAEFFATYNGSHFVLFRTFEKGVPLLNRKSRGYFIKDIKVFAQELIQQLAGIIRGNIGWEPDPRAFVNRLRVLHQRLSAEMMTSIKAAGNLLVDDWLSRQGWDVGQEDGYRRFGKQAAYLLLTKLLFYKILEDTGKAVPKIGMYELAVPEKRRKFFKKVLGRRL